MDLNFEVQESDEHAFKSFYDSLKEQHIPDLVGNQRVRISQSTLARKKIFRRAPCPYDRVILRNL